MGGRPLVSKGLTYGKKILPDLFKFSVIYFLVRAFLERKLQSVLLCYAVLSVYYFGSSSSQPRILPSFAIN